MTEKIELTFKSPTDRISPFIATVEKSWNVIKLKNYLMVNYPSKPTLESQKIIYCGKLLKNEQILKQIFQDKKAVIVHFLSQPSTEHEEVKVNTEAKENQDDLYNEYQAYLQGFYSNNIRRFNSLSPYQQYAWINQAYMQSYEAYYNQFRLSQPDTNKNVIQNPVTPESNVQDVENRAIDNDRPANADQNAVQNVMAAAFNGIVGGGEDENDGDAEPHDILHYFYMLVRLGLLLIICYYYSSGFSIFVTMMLFLLFVGVNFIRRYNHRPAVIPQRNNNPPANAAVAASDNEQGKLNENKEAETNEEGTSNALTQQGSADVPNQAQQAPQNDTLPELPPSILERIGNIASGTVNFVTTFFLTLFPDPIIDINAN